MPFPRLLYPVWFCAVCGAPVTEPVKAKREHCPKCGRLGMWARERSEYPDGCLIVGDEKEENKRRF